jgi:hypothetical protein
MYVSKQVILILGGRGTLKICEACKITGLPEPIIASLGGGLLVTIHQ